jgi:hypothetical protein
MVLLLLLPFSTGPPQDEGIGLRIYISGPGRSLAKQFHRRPSFKRWTP